MNKHINTFESFVNEKKSVLPEYLYHLTSSEKYENIKQEGLHPHYSIQSKREKGIYLAGDVYVAENYFGFYDSGTEVVLLKVLTKGLIPEKFGPDDYELQDFLNDGGWGNSDRKIKLYHNCHDVPWELSLKWVNQVQYHDTIPQQNIEVIKIFLV